MEFKFDRVRYDYVIDHEGSKAKNCRREAEPCGLRVSSMISLADPVGRAQRNKNMC